jgi:poly-gamma-glutamate capsule biosynthesis protein CapA/YwtB (metallophosphatase superfamily)
VTFAFAGDVHFEGPLRSALAADPAGVLAPIAAVLRRYDIAMVNLETAITQRGTPEPKQYRFRAPPSALTALTAAGVDVATEANNHGIDFGPVGLTDSLAARAQSTGVKVIGIGSNAADAYAPYRATVHGERIAILAASQVIDGMLLASWSATDSHGGIASARDVPRLLAAVSAARANSDTVIVFLHWGVEGARCPSSNQRTIAAQLVAAGADVVVGSHSHELEGAGHLGSALIDYGLGNFAFYAGTTSGILTVTMTGRHVDAFGWVPARISRGVPRPDVGPAATDAVTAWRALRACTDLAP